MLTADLLLLTSPPTQRKCQRLHPRAQYTQYRATLPRRHSHATRVSLHRTRNGVTETLFEIDPYCGYGGCQQFQPILDAPTLRQGDALEFRCLYDNDETLALGYGLSRGEEMCGPIIIYTPHDSRSVPRVSWHDGHYGEFRMPGGVWARVKGMLPLNKDGPHRSR